MKHMKMLGLLVMAAASLMAFAGSASATPVLTSTPGTEYTGEIHATMESGTSALMEAGISVTCTDTTVKGTVTTNTATHAAGPASVISNGSPGTPCTKDMATLAAGQLTINDKAEVFAIGNKVTVKDTGLGISCVYGGGVSPGTKIGTLTPGTPAKLKINTTELPKQEGGFFCTNLGTWTGNYVVTGPSSLFLT